MTSTVATDPADICLVLEGTYPYVAGGVSTWTHDLLLTHPDLRFHLVSLLPTREDREPRYVVPSNVIGMDHIYIQEIPVGNRGLPGSPQLFETLERALMQVQSPLGGHAELVAIMKALRPQRDALGRRLLLNSEAAWDMLVRMYEARFSTSSFLDYFWSWRALVGGLYSVMLPSLPSAKVYHTASTGYAGLFAARARIETGRPALVTEHGIYTNERRIEVAMANWLFEGPSEGLHVDITRRNLKDMWTDTFASYSRACYAASERIITLYEGNQQFQLDDGAAPGKLAIIPNGIAVDRYAPLRRSGAAPRDGGRPPHIALIGRVVPIKDVKTFIRACAMIRDQIADIKASVVGPTDEDSDYFAECRQLVARMGLESVITFTGPVRLDQFLGQVDVQVLTSISEGMPLVVLEAGAAGIPSVVTDVGACREMILGRRSEAPALGPAGAVTPLSSPRATADACLALLADRDWYLSCSAAMRQRVRRYYNKTDQDRAYRALYDEYMALPDMAPPTVENASAQAAE